MHYNYQPFYVGQKVVAVDAMQGSLIKNGQEYLVNDCHYSPSGNPIANGASFWYVGVVGHHRWLRPSIFAPIPEAFQSISYSKVIEEELLSVN